MSNAAVATISQVLLSLTYYVITWHYMPSNATAVVGLVCLYFLGIPFLDDRKEADEFPIIVHDYEQPYEFHGAQVKTQKLCSQHFRAM